LARNELHECIVDMLKRLRPNIIFNGLETGVCPSNRSDANRDAARVFLDITFALADFQQYAG
jgi:hypothetical protein